MFALGALWYFVQKSYHPDSTDPASFQRLLVFFAGHGTTVPSSRGPVGYLVPVDGRLDDKSTLIRWDDLTRNADIIPAKHILFVMDACYSGLAIQRAGQLGERCFVTDMLQRQSRQVITAGKADEVVADGGGPTGENSIFTGYLLEGLHGKAADDGGVITASNLMNYAYRKVSTDSRSHQTPHFGHIDGDGDFILWRPKEEDEGEDAPADFLLRPLVERPEPPPTIDVLPAAVRTLSERSGYGDPDTSDFGRNEWSGKLGEIHGNEQAAQCESAFGWLSLVIEPVSNEPVALEFGSLAMARSQLSGNPNDHDSFDLPSDAMTTAKSLLLFESADRWRGPFTGDCWKRYIRIERSGALEYCDFSRVASRVRPHDGSCYNTFWYVQMIGTIWTFLYVAKRILSYAGYTAGVRYIVNVIGTKDSILADFAHNKGKGEKKWRDPFERDVFGDGGGLSKWRCRDLNLQIPFKLVIGTLAESDIKKLVRECADYFGLAYNHQSAPRCFAFETDDFPWQQYRARD